MKLYYLFLLIMYILFNSCTSGAGGRTYSDKYEYSTQKDTTKSTINKHKKYSTNTYYNSSSSPSYKKKSYSSSRKSRFTKSRRRRR